MPIVGPHATFYAADISGPDPAYLLWSPMPKGKRRADAASRRFFDEFEKVRVSRFRAMGVVDPAKNYALIPFPNGKVKAIGTRHTWFKQGGGWSYFVCPRCQDRAVNLYLIDDAPLCAQCCNAINIQNRTAYGFGRAARRQASDKYLDRLIAKTETGEPLRLKPAPWHGKAKLLYNSRKLEHSKRRAMIVLRLNQLASPGLAGHSAKAYHPLAATRQLIEIKPIWKAKTTEALEQALDKAQCIIIAALSSPDLQTRMNAVKLMLRTKQARERGW
jgi:hypothetical protein